MSHRGRVVADLQEAHDEFLADFGIDPGTGELSVGNLVCDRRFACYPYVGSRYGEGDGTRLLVVGRDIGADPSSTTHAGAETCGSLECPCKCISHGQLQCWECRRRSIEDKSVRCHNPHIAGTYFTAMRFPQPVEEWEHFEGLKKPCQQILKNEEEGGRLPEINPLSRIALTNFYKWVTTGGKAMSTTSNRTHFVREREVALLIDEVRCLAPDVVVFQGAEFKQPRFEQLLNTVGEMGADPYVLYHPSRRPNDKLGWHKYPGEVVRPVC